jgi:calmodulin
MVDQLTETQITEFREVFTLYDKDMDGLITSKELQKIISSLGENIPLAKLESEISLHSPSSTNPASPRMIDFPGFMALIAFKMNNTETDEDLMEVFKFFDRDDTEGIREDEFLFMLKSMGADADSKLVKEIMAEGKKIGEVRGEMLQKDGCLGYEGFVGVLMGVNAPS